MKSLSQEKIFITILILFSIFINQYYGNRGVFPIDSFLIFDAAFNIISGNHPFRDYWLTTGPFVDYIQSFLFLIFGINWTSYVLHASILNMVLVLFSFYFFLNIGLKNYYAFIYALGVAILAYPSIGTPFVDHHSAFFSLLGIYSLILGIKTEKKLYWLLLPIFLGFAFLSKQVPSSYVIISVILSLSIYSVLQRKFYWIKYSFLSSILFILLLLIFGKMQGFNFLF